MQLIYLDESGNTGLNIRDAAQPVFVLCAMVVPEAKWLALETSLAAAVNALLPGVDLEQFEMHGTDLRSGDGSFRGVEPSVRLRLRDEWLGVAARVGIKVVYRAIEKSRYAAWLEKTFGAGVIINPHVVAFALVAKVVNDLLRQPPTPSLGMFISDENREITVDVEKSIKLLRGTVGTIGLSQIIEKGFFIDSRKSLPLQLCDLIAFNLRKREEDRLKLRVAKVGDASAFELLEPLLHRGDESFPDVIAWLTELQKRSDQSPKTRVG